MGEKIYRLILGDYSARWYDLSQEEQQKLLAWMNERRKEAGCTVILACRSRWATEHMGVFVVEEFPDIESEQKYVQALEDKNWFQYFDCTTYIGTKIGGQ
jgi:hypothetical protein